MNTVSSSSAVQDAFTRARQALTKKDWQEHEHPRESHTGKFTEGSGGGGGSAPEAPKSAGKEEARPPPAGKEEAKPAGKEPEKKGGAGVFRTALGLVGGYYGGKFAARLVMAAAAPMLLANPGTVAALGIAGGIVVGGTIYSLVTKRAGLTKKAEPLKLDTDEKAMAFLRRLPRYLTDEQMATLGAKLQAKADKIPK